MEDNFICAICMEYAEDAVETKCCHHIFCEGCLTQFQSKNCPTCRHDNYKTEISHLARRVIGGLEMTCVYNCGTKFPRSERKGHELHCVNKPFTCPAMGCQFQGNREHYLNHLITEHGSALIQNSEQLFNNGASGTAKNEAEIDRIKTTVNFKKNRARLGSSGKYYCAMALDGPHCNCCNGYCGPTNGCNCSSCMKLDVYVRKLSKYWLVNREGYACRKGTTGRFYCGRKVLNNDARTDGYCGPTNGNNCDACRKIDAQNHNRYAHVW